MVSFDAAGNWWNMNTATPRIDGRDQENGRRRYLAIDRDELKFTADPIVADYEEKISPMAGRLSSFSSQVKQRRRISGTSTTFCSAKI